MIFLLLVSVAGSFFIVCSNHLYMVRRLFQVFLIFLMLLIVCKAEGQSSRVPVGSAKYKYFQIPGRVKQDKGDPSGAVVRLIDLDSKQIEKSMAIPSSGKFDLELSYFKEYKISISKEGYYDKEILVSTVIPRDVWEKDSIFPPFYIVVTLYKKVQGAKLSFEGKPIGKVTYSPNGTLDNFDSDVLIDDQAIQDEIDTALKNIDDKDFNQKMAEALEAEKKNDLSMAYSLYSVASKIKPSDKFVKEKLKELASDLKNLGNEAKIQAEYDRFIALGDANVNSLKYNDAIQFYKGALKVKPNDPVAVSKIANAEKQLALANEKAKNDTEFNRLIAAGDANINLSKYADAISSFRQALEIRQGDSIALSRLADAEKQLAMAGDKAKKDAELSRLIAAGDANVGQSKYAEAITNFKSALDVKPNDSVALVRLADAEKQLAMAGDKAKKDLEFSRLITAGDANVGQSKYAEAITNFKSALDVKPNDSVALVRLADAEKQLAMAGDKAKKDAEFNRLIAAGDANVGQSKYAEAITNFKSALDVKPNDSVALARLAEAEKQLALAGDKVKKDAEFNRLIAAGDANITQSKYVEALTLYKSALILKSNEVVKAKISETERQILLAETERTRQESEKQAIALKQQKYKEAIDKANQLFTTKNYPESRQFYLQALSIDQVPVYPTERIREIDKIVAQMQLDKLANDQETTKTKLYNDAINQGGTYFAAKLYSEAISAYKEAQKIKPAEILPAQKINEIQLIIDGLASKALADQKFASEQNLGSNEKSYLDKLKIAEENYKKSQWTVARFYYIEALKFKQADSYAINKVDECDKMIDAGITDEKMQDYKNKISRADAEMKAKNYSSARFYYRSASDILKWEAYPKEQLNEIDRIVAEKLNESDQKLFTENLNKADEAFNRQEYPVARFYYNKAGEISQSDHVASRLKEVESIVNGSEAKKTDANYIDFIKKGDEAVKQNNSSIARFYYQKALALKPNERYPREEIKKMDSGVVNP